MHSPPSEASILRSLLEKEIKDHADTKALLKEAKRLLGELVGEVGASDPDFKLANEVDAFLVKIAKNE